MDDDRRASARDLAGTLVSVLPSWQLAVFRFNDRVAEALGIVASDLQCLFVLDRRGSSSPSEIARLVDLSTGATSRMIERLLRAGMVTRAHDTVDRRRVNVGITPAARRALHERYDPLDEHLQMLLEGMSADTLHQLLGFVVDAEARTAESAEKLATRSISPAG